MLARLGVIGTTAAGSFLGYCIGFGYVLENMSPARIPALFLGPVVGAGAGLAVGLWVFV